MRMITQPPSMRLAFLGRTSDEDAQDPSLSIPRQLRKCEDETAPLGYQVVAHYWEVESGRKHLDSRGIRGEDWSALKVPVPRNGGIQELIRDATTDRFDAVIVESIDRVSRMTADSTRIEQELERAGIALFAADEPMLTNATAILTRRVKQGIAEWYVRDLIEKSRRGMEESVRQGWHTGGRPPYGYMLEAHPHPNPSKAREGKHKHRLIIDPARGPVVLMIFEDYCLRRLGLSAICNKLNRDPGKYPPPIPNRKDENGEAHTWSKSVINSMLRNPKYTGLNVWGRHDKRRGRPLIRPREDWVWSEQPTHEAIISRELFDMVEERAQKNTIATNAGTPRIARTNKTQAGRFYALRGRVRCSMCGHRMQGSHQKGSNWYRCNYGYRRGEVAAIINGHPKVHGVKEDKLLGPVLDFLARRIFAPERLQLLRDELGATCSAPDTEHTAETERLKTELAKLDRSLRIQTLRLEEHEDPNHPIVQLASERIVELSTRRHAITDTLAQLKEARPQKTDAEVILAALDSIPDLRPTLATASAPELAEILRAFDVEIVYDKEAQTLSIAATITPELLTAETTKNDRPAGRSQHKDIAGAGFEPATFGL
jgi:site-specific DNA recombinase